MTSTLAQRVLLERRTLNWNQDELAAKAGVSRSYISHIERSQIPNPTIDVVEALAAALGSALDGPFGIAVYNTANSYTDTLSALIGDDLRWLSWYQFDNDMGRKGLCVTIKGGRVRRVRNLRQLARVIEACAR